MRLPWGGGGTTRLPPQVVTELTTRTWALPATILPASSLPETDREPVPQAEIVGAAR